MCWGGVLLFVSLLMLSIATLLGSKMDSDREKSSPFECGFDPSGGGRLPFSLRFFLIAIIFLVFDVEITLLLPLVMGAGEASLAVWALSGMLFLVVLWAGTCYEWQGGALDWKV
uniref:NADH-ubiquinone oxidoreductase chain 3 n=1 Tax=Bathynomus sp. YS-2016 TaxID=1863031 RepID=A0A1L2F0L5_9CRUS|nr:NADH dehydrogenase subunit 3 [Bathynomus sp. YS-2016]